MAYATNRDRAPTILEMEQTPWPAPPLNLFITGGHKAGVFDLVWTDPSSLSLNSRFQLCGVNIYRSFDSEFGPYDRINEYPIGSTFWRDQTDNVVSLDEPVQDWVLKGDMVAGDIESPRFVFRVTHYPIVKEGSQNLPTNVPDDVEVLIDGVKARILRVYGESGEIEIDPNPYPEVGTQSMMPPIVPGPDSVVTVTYRYNRSFLRTDLAQRVFYRVTTVGHAIIDSCGAPGDLTEMVETPLEHAAFTSSLEIEKIDWIWRESVRRNRWILDQGGERVKVFIRKQVGIVCSCFNGTTHHQPLSDCLICYGVGIVGGYEGPFDIVLAPDDAEKKVTQRDTGRSIEHSYEVWTGPSPLLSQRDFFVKINGERYAIGGIRMPTNRGMVLQQHFMVAHIDEKDTRYKVPLDNPNRFLPSYVQPSAPPLNAPAQITDKPNIPDERELRGRTPVWENIVY